MKKIIALSIFMAFVAGAIVCSDLFAQRSVNAADDAAKAARASLMNKPGKSSSQIEWLNQVVKVINMDDTATEENSKIKDE